MMTPEERQFFDDTLEAVLSVLPEQVHQLLDEVPLYVEDRPSNSVMRKMDAGAEDLCGLYTGIPLTQRSVEMSGVLSDVIHVYREGVTTLARRPGGKVDPDELAKQIRITILHELGHHHGLDEEELRELGY